MRKLQERVDAELAAVPVRVLSEKKRLILKEIILDEYERCMVSATPLDGTSMDNDVGRGDYKGQDE
jgi:hypothetical protein